MLDNDIIRFSQMPKFSQEQTDYVLSLETMNVIDVYLSDIENCCERLKLFSNAYTKILKHGVTDFIKEELSLPLAPYCINFESQSVSACLEGLSGLVERVWVAIKNTLIRLFNYVMDNTFLGGLFERLEFYRRRISEQIAGPLKNYTKVDVAVYQTRMISGISYEDFCTRMNCIALLIARLKNVGSYRLDSIDVLNVFSDAIRSANIEVKDGRLYLGAPIFTRE